MPDRVPERWAELAQFFGAYFHQDFHDVDGEPNDVVRVFTQKNPPEMVHRAADEAEDLARSIDDEHELRQTMLDLGLEYMPWVDGWSSAHAWLRHLAERFRG